MVVELGHVALIVAFLVAIVQMVVPMVGAQPRLGRLDAGRGAGGGGAVRADARAPSSR